MSAQIFVYEFSYPIKILIYLSLSPHISGLDRFPAGAAEGHGASVQRPEGHSDVCHCGHLAVH